MFLNFLMILGGITLAFIILVIVVITIYVNKYLG